MAHQRLPADVILRWKSVYAEENAFQHRFLGISNDPDVIHLKDRIDKLRAKLSMRIHHAAPEKDLSTVWHELIQAEKEVRQRAKAFKADLEASGINLNQVLSSLPQNSGLIEFQIFTPFDLKTGKPGKEHLAAYLLLSDIDSERQIFFKDLGAMEEFLKSHVERNKKTEVLYNYLFGKFDKHIKKLETIYMAPDGILNLISFASLRIPDGRLLVERQQVHRLQTGRDLMASFRGSTSNILVALAGVNYGQIISDEKALSPAKSGKSSMRLNMRATRELKSFKFLDHSLKEAIHIATIFKTNCRGEVHLYKGEEAREEKLKSLENPPRILHLSPHGFFLEDAEMQDCAKEEAPLLLSGLALAGANRGLKGLLDDNGDDGLLYSIEALGLNLQGTELVSLSACDTGKGVVDYSEGVYGLVRAFRTAGARSVLMTPRPVGDRSSRDFMERFYDIWLSSEDNPTSAEALHRTRLYFINHSKVEYRDPEIWDPYVVVGR